MFLSDVRVKKKSDNTLISKKYFIIGFLYFSKIRAILFCPKKIQEILLRKKKGENREGFSPFMVVKVGPFACANYFAFPFSGTKHKLGKKQHFFTLTSKKLVKVQKF